MATSGSRSPILACPAGRPRPPPAPPDTSRRRYDPVPTDRCPRTGHDPSHPVRRRPDRRQRVTPGRTIGAVRQDPRRSPRIPPARRRYRKDPGRLGRVATVTGRARRNLPAWPQERCPERLPRSSSTPSTAFARPGRAPRSAWRRCRHRSGSPRTPWPWRPRCPCTRRNWPPGGSSCSTIPPVRTPGRDASARSPWSAPPWNRTSAATTC